MALPTKPIIAVLGYLRDWFCEPTPVSGVCLNEMMMDSNSLTRPIYIGLVVAGLILAGCNDATTSHTKGPPKTSATQDVQTTTSNDFNTLPDAVRLCNIPKSSVLGVDSAKKYRQIPNLVVGGWRDDWGGTIYRPAAIIIELIGEAGNVSGFYA